MLIIIRISGQVGIPKKTEETLYRLRLRKKYSAVLLKTDQKNTKILRKIRNHIAYGDINEDTLKRLIEKRAIPIKKETKIDPDKIIKELEKKEINKLEIKPFFRLHPPIGGIDAKKHFGVSKKSVLGDNKSKINELVLRML